MENIKDLQKVQREEERKNAQKKSSKVHFWTVFMFGGRKCLENIYVHNHLKYHLWYFCMQI